MQSVTGWLGRKVGMEPGAGPIPEGAPPRLVSLDGAKDIPLDRAATLVGRDPRCDSRIESPRVSRLHCCLSRVDAEVTVRDLGSVNGTWINGRRTASGKLRAGDELSIAHVRYRLEMSRRRPGRRPRAR